MSTSRATSAVVTARQDRTRMANRRDMCRYFGALISDGQEEMLLDGGNVVTICPESPVSNYKNFLQKIRFFPALKEMNRATEIWLKACFNVTTTANLAMEYCSYVHFDTAQNY